MYFSAVKTKQQRAFSPPFNWRRFPFLPLAIAFGGGVLLCEKLDFYYSPLLWLFLLFPILLGFWLSSQRFAQQRARQWLNGLLLLTVLLLGYWRTAITHPPNQTGFFAQAVAADTISTWLVSIENISAGEDQLRFTSSVLAAVGPDSLQAACGRLLLYLTPSPKAARLVVGDQILVRTSLNTIPKPRNPYAFDAAAYWATQSVYHRAFIKEDTAWMLATRAGKKQLRALAEGLRLQWLNSFRPHLTGDELAVAAALVLGKRDLISEELQSAYADTGAVHVLAVSGLHVGIIAWMVLGLLTWWLPARPWAKKLQPVLAIVAIWGFALLTGLGPSVQRAATMFSIIMLASFSKRRTNLFNSLAAAALFMLYWQPMQLFQVGFQLSFSAVVGIGLFLRPIQKAFYFPWAWQRTIWSVLSVSLAAQLGTLPFSIYYFHQLPLYFLLTGSVVILTAYGALGMGILHGLAALMGPWLATLTGKGLWLMVFLQNTMVHLGAKLPGARQEIAWINGNSLALLLLFIACLAAWLSWRRFTTAVLGLVVLTVFFVGRLTQGQVLSAQQRKTVYHLPKKTLIDFVSGHQAFSITDPAIGPRDIHFSAQQHRSARQFTSQQSWWPSKQSTDSLSGVAYVEFPLLEVHGQRWLWWNGQALPEALVNEPPQVLLLMADRPPPADIASVFKATKEENAAAKHVATPYPTRPIIILDGSRSYFTQRAWETWRDSTQWPVHITAVDGAFVAED